MKKLTALILTLSMLLSMCVIPMGVTATEITEAERQEMLNTREHTYLDFNPNIDAFASIETIRNYATTQRAVVSSDAFNKVTEVYDEDGETVLYTYMNQIFNETHDGDPISGNETYYKKGIANASVDAIRVSPLLFLTESFKLTADEIKALSIKTYSDLSSSDSTQNPKTIAAARYADSTKFASKTTNFSKSATFYLPTVVKTEEAGDNYNVYIKDPETSIQFKLGPINDSEFVKNALDVTKNANTVTFSEGTKGKYLSVVATTADSNQGTYSGDYVLNLGSPKAVLQTVEITYNDSDNTSEEKYMLLTNAISSPYEDKVGLAIYSADKYDSEGNEIVYDYKSFQKTTSTTNPLTALTGTGLTLDDIIFPSNVYAKEINVGILNRARQDTATSSYANKATLGMFELQDKEIKSVKFLSDTTRGDDKIDGIIPLPSGNYGSGALASAPCALIPVQLPADKADANKVYYAYVGRIANSSAVLSATLSSETPQEKIDALNEVLSALDSESLEEEEIADYRAQIAAVKAESEYILDSDFDTTALDAAEERIAEAKAEERATEIVNTPNRTQFPLSTATGANSRLFVLNGTESEIAKSGYLSGIDFYGRLKDSKKDAETDYYIPYSMYDGTDSQTGLIFKQDENGKYVEITHYGEETKKYYVNPDERVIKVTPVDATETYYGDNAEAAESLNGCTIDIPDGKYESIGYLAGATYQRTPIITLIYEDESVSATDVPMSYHWSSESFRGASGTDSYNYYIADWNYTKRAKTGVFRFSKVEDLTETTNCIGYKESTVAVDPDRVLTAIKFATNSAANPLSIISLWGNKATVAEKLAELEAIEVTDAATLATAKAALADFDTYLTDLGYTLDDLASYKAPYTNLQTAVADYEDALKADRLSQTVYAPIEMDLLTDYFGTMTERDKTNWLSSDVYSTDYLSYLGYKAQASQFPTIRTAATNGAVISVNYTSGTPLTSFATLKDGRYTMNIGNVPYRLGAITENILDANAFTPGDMITVSDKNLLNDRLDEKYAMVKSTNSATSGEAALYTGTSYYTVTAAKFPVDIAGASKVNVVTTSLVQQGTATAYSLYAVDAKVYLDNGEEVDYVLLTGPGGSSGVDINDAILFVPKNSETSYTSYATINDAIGGGEVLTLDSMEGVELSDIKLPSAPKVAGPSIASSNLAGLTGGTIGKNSYFYYQNVILPESQQTMTLDRGTYTTLAYASSFELTAPEGRTITAVEFIHDSGTTLRDGYAKAETVGAYALGTGSDTRYLVPATVDDLTGYQAYVRITRNCHFSAVLGMTAESTGADVVANLNTLMADATESDIADIEAMKAYIDGETVLYTDLDAAARAKYEAIAEAANVAGTIALADGENGAKTVTANIKNITGLAGKIYTLIIAFYDADGNLIKAVPQQYATSAVKSFSQTLTVENVPENTDSVKGFIWKDFKTLIPLGTEAE